LLGQLLEGGELAPLHIETHVICEPGKAVENVQNALSLSYPVLMDRCETVSICGAGPSLARTYSELRGDVMACNSAIGWLHDRGVHITSAMMFDADPVMVKFARRIEGVKYYLASRCDPSVFDALKGMDITVWHALGDEGLIEYLESTPLPRHKHGTCVMGGSAAVTRAVYLARALGYTDIHLFGADSSCEDDTHVNGSVVEEETVEVYALGKKYKTTRWMAAQAQEFQVMWKPVENTGCKVTVHGDGLLPDLWRWMSAG
jgi:hypothetical protein